MHDMALQSRKTLSMLQLHVQVSAYFSRYLLQRIIISPCDLLLTIVQSTLQSPLLVEKLTFHFVTKDRKMYSG